MPLFEQECGMKLEKVGKKNSKSLYGAFLWMTLLPLFLSGVVMIFACSYHIKSNITEEIHESLRTVATSVLAAYDEMYEGDYNIALGDNEVILYKGSTEISGETGFIDKIYSSSGIDISIFFYDTRVLTTLCDADDVRMVGSGVNTKILDEVFSAGHDMFYDNIRIGNRNYFAYYVPIYSSDQSTCLGMIGVAKPSSDVNKFVNRSVYGNLAIILAALVITAFFILRFASEIVSVIKKMMAFLKELSENNLSATLDEGVSHRGDELGVMGRFMIKLQSALKKLIERDVLTGLYNRRSAEKKIDEIENGCRTYSVSIGDIDHFKKFNDTYGHECGDVVLREVAHLLNDHMKGLGFVARWGGEEFLLVYENADIDSAYVALLQIREALHEMDVEYNGEIHKVTMTFGVEEKHEGVPINQLIRAADDKLYEGKQGGRDRVCK